MEVGETIKNKWYIFCVVTALLLVFSLKFLEPISKTFTILFFVLFIISLVTYNLKVKKNKEDLFFPGSLRLVYLTFIGILFAIYLATLLQELSVAIITSAVLGYTILLITFFFMLISLLKSKKIHSLLISYVLFSLSMFALFSYIFLISNLVPNSGLIYEDDSTVSKLTDIFYFTSSVFYTSPLEGIKPTGLSKLITQVELAISFMVHVIVLSIVIARLKIK